MNRYGVAALSLILLACGDDASAEDDAGKADAGAEDAGGADAGGVGVPVFPDADWRDCADEPGATPEGLAEKAAHYDEVALRLHLHPVIGQVLSCDLEEDATESDATYEDVANWIDDQHSGISSGLYLASQAYRYAVTREPEVLETIRAIVDNEVRRMALSGVPGLFVRAYRPPGLTNFACPEDPAAYTPSPDGGDNKFVRIDDEGCYEVTDPDTLEWRKTDHCGLEAFAGFCIVDNVSKDIYSGHLYSLSTVYRLVDDADVQAKVKDLASQIGHHLMDNELQIIDWDGTRTEHGDLYASAIGLGLNASVAVALMQFAVNATDDPELRAFFDDCMLQKSGEKACIGADEGVPPRSYAEHVGTPRYLLLTPGCDINVSNISINLVALHHLIWLTDDPELRAIAQDTMDRQVVRIEHPRRPIDHDNPFWNFMWASQKRLTPEDGHDFDAVEAGVCQLRHFPTTREQREVHASGDHEITCEARGGQPATDAPLPVDERCTGNFDWWSDDPYVIKDCDANPSRVYQPALYLLPYWMGRYYGFIDPTW